jgi:hypothetical protein
VDKATGTDRTSQRPTVPPPIVSPDVLQKHADRLNRKWEKFVRQTVASTIEQGQMLLELKDKLPPGCWERLFAGHPQSVADPIRYSVRTAQMFIQIASNPILTNEANHGSLPSSWRTLVELARLPSATLQRALTAGQVHTEMERVDVLSLQSTRKSPRPRGAALDERRAVASAQREIAATLRRLWIRFPTERVFFVQEVSALAGTPLMAEDIEDTEEEGRA